MDKGTTSGEHTLSDRSYPWLSSNHQTPSWCLGCISSGFLSIQTMVPVVNNRSRVGATASLPTSLRSIQSPLPCSRRYMNIPRLAQSFDQRDHGDWARFYCHRLALEYDIARIESVLKISLIHKPSKRMDCPLTLKRLAPFLSSPTHQISVNVVTIELNGAFFFKEGKQFKKFDAGRLSASFYNDCSRSCGKNGIERSQTVKGIYAEATSTTRTWFKLFFTHIYKQPRV